MRSSRLTPSTAPPSVRPATCAPNRNKLSKQIGALMGQAKKDPSKAAEAEEIKKQVTAQADRLKELEAKETELQAKIQEICDHTY